MVYFASHYAHDIEHVSAKGGPPKVLIPGPAMVMGLAYAAKEQRLYVSDQARITRWRLDGKEDGAVLESDRIITILALDEKAGRLFWTDMGRPAVEGRGSVASCDTKGDDQRVLVSGLSFPKVAVNPTKGLLYWTQQVDSGGVWMAKLDGTEKRRIAEVETLADALAVDSSEGIVFWASVENAPTIPARITAASFDGSNPKTLATVTEGMIEGLAVNEDARRIVWLERTRQAPARIRSAKFDGSDVKTIWEFPGQHFARAVTVGPPRRDG